MWVLVVGIFKESTIEDGKKIQKLLLHIYPYPVVLSPLLVIFYYNTPHFFTYYVGNAKNCEAEISIEKRASYILGQKFNVRFSLKCRKDHFQVKLNNSCFFLLISFFFTLF